MNLFSLNWTSVQGIHFIFLSKVFLAALIFFDLYVFFNFLTWNCFGNINAFYIKEGTTLSVCPHISSDKKQWSAENLVIVWRDNKWIMKVGWDGPAGKGAFCLNLRAWVLSYESTGLKERNNPCRLSSNFHVCHIRTTPQHKYVRKS